MKRAKIYQEFERICHEHARPKGKVLEVGAVPGGKSLLAMPFLAEAEERVGINLDGPHECDGYRILNGNGNSMECFPDAHFDLVMSNATFEHDPFFWKTVEEMHRVTKSGGLIVVSAPGYRTLSVERCRKYLAKIPFLSHFRNTALVSMLFRGTITTAEHDAPGDYYRFSPQAFRDVILGGLKDVQVKSLNLPPRLIGFGFKP